MKKILILLLVACFLKSTPENNSETAPNGVIQIRGGIFSAISMVLEMKRNRGISQEQANEAAQQLLKLVDELEAAEKITKEYAELCRIAISKITEN